MEKTQKSADQKVASGYEIFGLNGQPFEWVGRNKLAPAVMAEKSAQEIYSKLKTAQENRKMITILLHAPPGAGKSITLQKISESIATGNIPDIEVKGFPITASLQEISISNLADQTLEGIKRSFKAFYGEKFLNDFNKDYELKKTQLLKNYSDKVFIKSQLIIEALKTAYNVSNAQYLFYVIDEFDAILPGSKEHRNDREVSVFLHQFRSLLDDLSSIPDIAENQLPLVIAMSHTEASNKEFMEYINEYSDALSTSIASSLELGYSLNEIYKFFEVRLQSKRIEKVASNKKYYPFSKELIKRIYEYFMEKPDKLVNMRGVDRCSATILEEGSKIGKITPELVDKACDDVIKSIERGDKIPPAVKRSVSEVITSSPIKKSTHIYDALLYLLENELIPKNFEAPNLSTIIQTGEHAATMCQIPLIYNGKTFTVRLGICDFQTEPTEKILNSIKKEILDDDKQEFPNERIIIYSSSSSINLDDKDLKFIRLSDDTVWNLLVLKRLQEGHGLKTDILSSLYKEITLVIKGFIENIKDLYYIDNRKIITRNHEKVIMALAAKANFAQDLDEIYQQIHDKKTKTGKFMSELEDMGFIQNKKLKAPPSLQILLDKGDEFSDQSGLNLLGKRWRPVGLSDLISNIGVVKHNKSSKIYVKKKDSWKKETNEIIDTINQEQLNEQLKAKFRFSKNLLIAMEEDSFINAINYHTANRLAKQIKKTIDEEKKKKIVKKSPCKDHIIQLIKKLKVIIITGSTYEKKILEKAREQLLNDLEDSMNNPEFTKDDYKKFEEEVNEFIKSIEEPEKETETQTETGTETGTETQTETGTETQTETGTETQTGTETGTETQTETGTETQTETGTETGFKERDLSERIIGLFNNDQRLTFEEVKNEIPGEDLDEIIDEIDKLLMNGKLRLTRGI